MHTHTHALWHDAPLLQANLNDYFSFYTHNKVISLSRSHKAAHTFTLSHSEAQKMCICCRSTWITILHVQHTEQTHVCLLLNLNECVDDMIISLIKKQTKGFTDGSDVTLHDTNNTYGQNMENDKPRDRRNKTLSLWNKKWKKTQSFTGTNGCVHFQTQSTHCNRPLHKHHCTINP